MSLGTSISINVATIIYHDTSIIARQRARKRTTALFITQSSFQRTNRTKCAPNALSREDAKIQWRLKVTVLD